jgi:hypothetical protein
MATEELDRAELLLNSTSQSNDLSPGTLLPPYAAEANPELRLPNTEGMLLRLAAFSQGEPLLAECGFLEAVSQSFEADIAILWSPDSRQIGLRCVQHWSAEPETDAALLADLSKLELWPIEGLPGRVWAHGRSEMLDELAGDRHTTRGTILAKAGIRSAFGVPARSGAETLLVLELLSRRPFAFHSAPSLRVNSLSERLGAMFQRASKMA